MSRSSSLCLGPRLPSSARIEPRVPRRASLRWLFPALLDPRSGSVFAAADRRRCSVDSLVHDLDLVIVVGVLQPASDSPPCRSVGVFLAFASVIGAHRQLASSSVFLVSPAVTVAALLSDGVASAGRCSISVLLSSDPICLGSVVHVSIRLPSAVSSSLSVGCDCLSAGLIHRSHLLAVAASSFPCGRRSSVYSLTELLHRSYSISGRPVLLDWHSRFFAWESVQICSPLPISVQIGSRRVTRARLVPLLSVGRPPRHQAAVESLSSCNPPGAVIW